MSLTSVHESVKRRFGHRITLARGLDSVTLTACLHRDKEQGLAGSATQSSPTYHIIASEIAGTVLVIPKAKDKLTDGSTLRTVNSVEEIMAADDSGQIIGWRLRTSG